MKPKPVARIDLAGQLTTLRPGERLKLGRAIDNDIVLPKRSISRYHALVVWHEGARLPVVRDLGSQNGTLLNGISVSNSPPLNNGARIVCDSFELVVRLENVEAAPALLEEDSPLSNPLDDRPGMAGLLSGSGAGRELLLMLEREQRTGNLLVGKERLMFCMGRVMIRKPEDRRALTRMALAKRGTYYRFDADFDAQSSCSRQLLWPSHLLGESRVA